jgi:hypothetical protein
MYVLPSPNPKHKDTLVSHEPSPNCHPQQHTGPTNGNNYPPPQLRTFLVYPPPNNQPQLNHHELSPDQEKVYKSQRFYRSTIGPLQDGKLRDTLYRSGFLPPISMVLLWIQSIFELFHRLWVQEMHSFLPLLFPKSSLESELIQQQENSPTNLRRNRLTDHATVRTTQMHKIISKPANQHSYTSNPLQPEPNQLADKSSYYSLPDSTKPAYKEHIEGIPTEKQRSGEPKNGTEIKNNTTSTQLPTKHSTLVFPLSSLRGGGRVKTEPAQQQPWKYPETTIPKGPILLATLPDPTEQPQWKPDRHLLTIRDCHPLDTLLTDEHLTVSKNYCTLDPDLAIVYSQLKPTTVVTTSSFRDLLSPGTAINDEVMAIFLEIVCSELNLAFLCPQFLPLLMRNGWSQITRYFAAGNRRHHRSTFRPLQRGEKRLRYPVS